MARSLVERMAARLVLFAVRHASLLRPLAQAGKLQLAKASCCSRGGFLAWRGVAWGAQFSVLAACIVCIAHLWLHLARCCAFGGWWQ